MHLVASSAFGVISGHKNAVTHWFAECGLCPMIRIYFACAFHSLWTADGFYSAKVGR